MWVNAAPRLAMPRAAGASPRSPANFVTLLGPILQSMRSSLYDGDSITASGAMLAASPCDDRREQRRFGTVLEKRGNATLTPPGRSFHTPAGRQVDHDASFDKENLCCSQVISPMSVTNMSTESSENLQQHLATTQDVLGLLQREVSMLKEEIRSRGDHSVDALEMSLPAASIEGTGVNLQTKQLTRFSTSQLNTPPCLMPFGAHSPREEGGKDVDVAHTALCALVQELRGRVQELEEEKDKTDAAHKAEINWYEGQLQSLEETLQNLETHTMMDGNSRDRTSVQQEQLAQLRREMETLKMCAAASPVRQMDGERERELQAQVHELQLLLDDKAGQQAATAADTEMESMRAQRVVLEEKVRGLQQQVCSLQRTVKDANSLIMKSEALKIDYRQKVKDLEDEREQEKALIADLRQQLLQRHREAGMPLSTHRAVHRPESSPLLENAGVSPSQTGGGNGEAGPDTQGRFCRLKSSTSCEEKRAMPAAVEALSVTPVLADQELNRGQPDAESAAKAKGDEARGASSFSWAAAAAAHRLSDSPFPDRRRRGGGARVFHL